MIPPSLFSLQVLPHTPPCSLSNSWLLFISCYIHVCLCIYIYSFKYNLLGLYKVTCLRVFRADLWVLDLLTNWCVLPGGRHFSHPGHFLVACGLWLRHHGLFPAHVSMSVAVVFVQFRFGLLCPETSWL